MYKLLLGIQASTPCLLQCCLHPSRPGSGPPKQSPCEYDVPNKIRHQAHLADMDEAEGGKPLSGKFLCFHMSR